MYKNTKRENNSRLPKVREGRWRSTFKPHCFIMKMYHIALLLETKARNMDFFYCHLNNMSQKNSPVFFNCFDSTFF